MGKINMKGGTAVGWVSMCNTCAWAHIMTGHRESELAVVCTDVSPNVAVPFKVRECTGYLDKNRPNYDQMEKLAIDVLPVSSAKPVGFRAKPAEIERNDAEVARG
jgi:hypothetical protein